MSTNTIDSANDKKPEAQAAEMFMRTDDVLVRYRTEAQSQVVTFTNKVLRQP